MHLKSWYLLGYWSSTSEDSKLYGHRRVTHKFYVEFLKDFSAMLIAKVHCRLCSGPKLDLLLRQMKNKSIPYSCTLSKMYFNIVLVCTPESARTSLSFRFSCKNFVGTDIHTCPTFFMRASFCCPTYIHGEDWAQQICYSAGGIYVW